MSLTVAILKKQKQKSWDYFRFLRVISAEVAFIYIFRCEIFLINELNFACKTDKQ